MKKVLSHFTLTACLLFAVAPVQAELPSLSEAPWQGYFLAIPDKKFQFGITSAGATILEPLLRNGTPVDIHSPVRFRFEILETTPDGNVVRHQIQPEKLVSTSPAIIAPDKPVIITGETTGNATFEITLIPERRSFSLTGKITDKGTLKNPLRFAISAEFTPYHANLLEPDALKDFLKRIKREEIRGITLAGKRVKLGFTDEGNPATLHPEGFSNLEIRSEAYGAVSFKFDASKNSQIILTDKGEQPLHKNFVLTWTANQEADPEAEKFTIEVK